jgi:protein-S-isoprenylcysteine O-methyltransferase Ste14
VSVRQHEVRRSDPDVNSGDGQALGRGGGVKTVGAPSLADILLFAFTLAELLLLLSMLATLSMLDSIYVLQHLIVLVIAFSRSGPQIRDYSLSSSIACFIALAYPYAQVLYLRFAEGYEGWPEAGMILVMLGAGLSLTSLISLGRFFGIRPALRGLTTQGPYRIVRHPMYLSYFIADAGLNLQSWNGGTVFLTLSGWAALMYRIQAEEKILKFDPKWSVYARRTRYRLFPGIW